MHCSLQINNFYLYLVPLFFSISILLRFGSRNARKVERHEISAEYKISCFSTPWQYFQILELFAEINNQRQLVNLDPDYIFRMMQTFGLFLQRKLWGYGILNLRIHYTYVT